MDKLTKKIKILNDAYHSIEKSLKAIRKMFVHTPYIKNKANVIAIMFDNLYKAILEKLEADCTNEEFIKIIKNIKNEK